MFSIVIRNLNYVKSSPQQYGLATFEWTVG